MKTTFFLFCALCLGLALLSCEHEEYTDVLQIGFISLSFEDVHHPDIGTEKKAILIFSFIDGNGKIGARDDNNISKIHYTWYKKLANGNYDTYQFLSGKITDSIAIPYRSVMDKSEAQNKTLKGTIKMELSPPLQRPDADTMRIGFFIFDRDGKRSLTEKEDSIEYTREFHIKEIFDN